MKKISKRQKMILLIAIVIIIVIVGAVLGINAIRVNIANGKYNSSNGSSSNGNLLPEYIKEGITIGGITGTLADLDTSDATATPEDIAEGKTAYVKGVKITGTRSAHQAISKTDSFVGYYADIEGNGTVDGVIYADLAVGNTGDGQWHDRDGNYTIPKETNLKDYYIIKESYSSSFGDKPVLAPISSSGNERFYVMALNDVDSSTHYWYLNAYGKISDYSSQTSGDFGTGRTNTQNILNQWNYGGYGSKNDNDMWNFVKTNWFIPSKGEWSAFAEGLNISSGKQLSATYWTSTLYSNSSAYLANTGAGYIDFNYIKYAIYVRLSTTF